MPWTYRHASREWRFFLDQAAEEMGLSSDNMTYTAIDGVFRVFRRRLSVQEALLFANVLPSVPRAIFVQDWDITAPAQPFLSKEEMTREAQAVRPHHNLTPDNAIEAVAIAIRRTVPKADWDRVLAQLPKEAATFWAVCSVPEKSLQPQII